MKNRKKCLIYRSKTRDIQVIQKYIYSENFFDDIHNISSNVVAISIREDSIKITYDDLLFGMEKKNLKVRTQTVVPRVPKKYYYEVYRDNKLIKIIDKDI